MSSYGQTARNPARPNGNNVINQNGGQYQIAHVPVNVGHAGYDQSQQIPVRGPYPTMALPQHTPITFQQFQQPVQNYYQPMPPADQNYTRHQMHQQPNVPNFPGYPQQYFMNPMAMGIPGQMAPNMQTMQGPPPAVPPAEKPVARERKPLLICDPKTKEAVDVHGLGVKDAGATAQPSTDQTAATSEIKKQFANKLLETVKAKLDEKPTDATVPQKEVPQPTTQNVNTTKPSLQSTPAEAAPSTQVDVNKNAAQNEQSKEKRENLPTKQNDTQDKTITSLEEETTDEKENETIVAPAITRNETDEAPAAVAMTGSVLVDNIDEEDETDGKSEDEKAAEEAERKTQRESELVTQMKTLEEQIEMNIYSREFLSLVCTIEKEFKWTQCPLTDDQLKTLGLDKSSVPARETNKGGTFNPNWMKSNKPRPYVGGRGSMDSSMRGGNIQRGQHPRKPPIGRPSIERQIERAAPLRRTENAWKPDKKTDGCSEDEIKKKQVLKNVRALMNKVTPTTQKELTQELLSFEVSNDPEVLKDVIEIIFDKAVEEPKFCPLYSEMCKVQVDLELKKGGNASLFRNAILTRSQRTFETSKAEDDARREKVQEIETEADEQKKAQLALSLQEYDSKIRRRRFGNITFIGQLFYQQLLSYKVVSWCIMTLLRESTVGTDTFSPETEEAIDCSVRLMESIGPKMEAEGKRFIEKAQQEAQQQQRGRAQGQAQPPQKVAGLVTFDQFMGHIEEIKKRASARIRFMIMNLQELRNNNWHKRKVADQGPKKLNELHEEIKQEQIQNQVARDRYERDQGRGPSNVNHRSDAQKRPVVGRNSLNAKVNPNERRKAAANTANMSGTGAAPQQKKSLMTAMNMSNNQLGRPSWGSKGASIGLTENERKNSNAQGERGSRETSEQRKLSVDDERAKAIDSVRAITQNEEKARPVTATPPPDSTSRDGSVSPNPIRSSSQVSLDEQNDEPIELSAEEKKAAQAIHGCIEEVQSGYEKIETCPEDFLKTMKKNGLTVRALFKAFAVTVLRETKQDQKLTGHILAYFLQSEELKREMIDETDVAKGFADFCNYVITSEEYEECPNIWERFAEVIINAVYCDLPDFTEKRPQLENFALTFLEASKDPRSKRPAFELLVVALKRMAEINKGLEQDHEALTAMTYDEIKFIQKLSPEQSTKLAEALKEQKIDGVGNLHALLKGTS
ncbi:unnamed protein product, partial [Mesorhabditis belari]|uniref:MIF4G domain-containing protein n=1 Tax=Mesorhabditis belari TaxID=2138241 RepID=A0AAF3EZN1_9BILA